MNRWFAILAFLVLAGSVWAQGPAPLRLRVTLSNAVEVANTYTSPAVAWVVQHQPRDSNKAGAVVEWHDCVLDPSATCLQIAPGASERWQPAAGITNFGLRLLAVLYEDGSSYGEPSVLHDLLDARQFVFKDAGDDVRLLDDFQKQRNGDFARLVRQFEARGTQHNNELAARFHAVDDAHPIPIPDWLCGQIVKDLRSPAARPDDKLALVESAKLDALRSYDLLHDSQPRLTAGPDGVGWHIARADAVEKVTRMEAGWRSVLGVSLFETRVRNSYEAPATAWVIETRYQNEPAPQVEYADQLLMGRAEILAPGRALYGSRRFEAGRRIRGREVVGVIYADGAIAGQRKYVDALLGRRRVIFASLSEALEAFMATEATPGAGRADAERKLEACTARIQAFLTQTGIPERDSLCAPALAGLRTPGHSIDWVRTRYGARLEAIYQRLKISKPSVEQMQQQPLRQGL